MSVCHETCVDWNGFWMLAFNSGHADLVGKVCSTLMIVTFMHG